MIGADFGAFTAVSALSLIHPGDRNAYRFSSSDDWLQENMVVKDDLKDFATKADLERFATKADLEHFATKADLAGFATKSDLQNELNNFRSEMVTKSDFKWLEERTRQDTNAIVEEVVALRKDVNALKGYPLAEYGEGIL